MHKTEGWKIRKKECSSGRLLGLPKGFNNKTVKGVKSVMGHKKSDQYRKTVSQAMTERLTSMLKAGEGRSKHRDRADDVDKDKIYSFSTFKTYKRQGRYYAEYLEKHHPEVTSLKKARKYVGEYLQTLVDAGRSAWTVQTAAKALGKVFGITKDDEDYFAPPVRHREDIKRSREKTKSDVHFSEKRNEELVKFCRATGLRREGMKRIRGKDLWTREQIVCEIERIKAIPTHKLTKEDSVMLRICEDTNFFTHNEKYFVMVKEKGGRPRLSPVIGPEAEAVAERFRSRKPDEKVWQTVHKHADIHGYRAEYATALYREYARPIEDIPYDKYNNGSKKFFQGDVYVCRGELAGTKFDKKAALVVEKAIGHNTLHTFIQHYARNI